MSNEGPMFEVLSPTGAVRVESLTLAAPLEQMAGARVALVWDGLFKGDQVFAALADELATTFTGMTFVGHEPFGDIHGADADACLLRMPDVLREHDVDAVVVAVGA